MTELRQILYGQHATRKDKRTIIHDRLVEAFELGGIVGLYEYIEARLNLNIDSINTRDCLAKCSDLVLTYVGRRLHEERQESLRRKRQSDFVRQLKPQLIRERQQQRLIDEASRTAHVARHIRHAA